MFLPGGNYKFYSGLDQSIMDGLRDVWLFNPNKLWKMPRYTDFYPSKNPGVPFPGGGDFLPKWPPPWAGGGDDHGGGTPPWWPGGDEEDDNIGGPPPWWTPGNDDDYGQEEEGSTGDAPPWWTSGNDDETTTDPYSGSTLIEIFQQSEKLLTQYDRNGNGQVTIAEISKYNPDFASIAELADFNGDGVLDTTENMAIYKYADSQENLDGVISADEIKKAKANIFDDEERARIDLSQYHDDIKESLNDLEDNDPRFNPYKRSPNNQHQTQPNPMGAFAEWMKDFFDMVIGFMNPSTNNPKNRKGW